MHKIPKQRFLKANKTVMATKLNDLLFVRFYIATLIAIHY